MQAWLITVLHTVRGLELAVASSALTGYMVGATMGVLAGGWVADAYKHRVLGFTIVVDAGRRGAGGGVDVLPLPGVAAIGVMFLAGFMLGTSRTPRDVMLKDAAPPGQIGKVFGFVSAGLPLGAALTPVPFGFLIDRGHPEMILLLVAGLLVLSLFCIGAARTSARAALVPVPAE